MSFKLTSQSSGAFPSPLLLDQFPGATVLLSLSRESSSYNGNCVTISRSNGSSSFNIGLVGNALDMVALGVYLSSGRAFCDIWYGQDGLGQNATPLGGLFANRYEIIIDTDGKPSLIPNSVRDSTSGMVIADASSHKTTVIDCYIVGKIGYANFDSSAYWRCIMGWMATNTTAWHTGSRWAFGLTDDAGMELIRNATEVSAADTSIPSNLPLSGGRQTQWQCHHYNTERVAYRVNDGLFWDNVTRGGGSTANVTYSGTGQIYIGCQAGVFADTNGTHANSNSSFRTIALWGTSRSDHAAIAAYLTARWSVVTSFPTTWAGTGDGFTWTPEYSANFNLTGSDDANGLRYWFENPGYQDDGTRGPSQASANNVNNGIAMYRTAIVPYDEDGIVTGAERSERGIRLGASTTIAVGDDFETYVDLFVEDGPEQDGSWALGCQFHANGGPDADLCYLDMKGNKFTVFTQRGGVSTARSTPLAYSRGAWYSIRWSGHLSGASSDTLNVWLGPHGSMTQVTTASGPLFPTSTGGAFVKQGLYRGEQNIIDVPPNTNLGLFAVRWANQKFSKTIGAYASLLSSPTTLPTH